MKAMKVFYLLAVVCTFAYSCGTPEDRTSDKEEDTTDISLVNTLVEDAPVIALPEIEFDINALLSKTNKLHELPFLLDSSVVESMDKEAWKKASTLTQFLRPALSGAGYIIFKNSQSKRSVMFLPLVPPLWGG